MFKPESNIATDWFETNKMIVKPGKFQSITINKKKQDHTKETFEIGDKVIEALLSVKLFEVQIDNKLSTHYQYLQVCSKSIKCFNKAQAILKF